MPVITLEVVIGRIGSVVKIVFNAFEPLRKLNNKKVEYKKAIIVEQVPVQNEVKIVDFSEGRNDFNLKIDIKVWKVKPEFFCKAAFVDVKAL